MVKANRAAYYPFMPIWIGVALGGAVGSVGRLPLGRALQEPSGAFVASTYAGLLTARTLE